jgi:hypothetical protein
MTNLLSFRETEDKDKGLKNYYQPDANSSTTFTAAPQKPQGFWRIE